MANGGIDPVYTDTSESTATWDFSPYQQIEQCTAPSNRNRCANGRGKRKLFLKNIAGKAKPDRYLANLSSRILGWLDRDTQWMCEA